METARWTDDHAALETMIDWSILQRTDFERADNYPDKMERYQAEALAHEYVPVTALAGLACATKKDRDTVADIVADAGLSFRVKARPSWYFP